MQLQQQQHIMSTGKRLAKRSIIGTRVCAPGFDGKYYSGAISAVNTPYHNSDAAGGLSITSSTRYSVRFDPVAGAPDVKREYLDRDLIGPGFGSVMDAKLVPGQKVFLTYNGREIQAEVTQHRQQHDEVDVKITVAPASNGQEGMMHLTKRIEEVRLLESRKSARLADSDTDFARLADVGSDRKRASSHSIDVSTFIGSRKRRPSSSNDSERSYNAWNDSANNNNNNNNNNSSHNHNHHQHHNNNNRQTSVVTSTQAQSPAVVAPVQATQTSGSSSAQQTTGAMNLSMTASSGGSEPQEAIFMDECSAAMVLMSLSTPPKNPLPIHCQQAYGSWDDGINNRVTIGSPGNSNSSQSSSSASWRSATPSPPLSDDPLSHSAGWAANHPNNHHNHHQLQQHQHHHHSQTHQSPGGQVPVVDQRRYYHRQHHPYAVVHRSNSHRRHRGGAMSSSSSSPNNSPYDEGIVPDLDQERPRKKRIRSIENDEDYMSANNTGSSSDNDVKNTIVYKCTWRDDNSRQNSRSCGHVADTWDLVADHVFRQHLQRSRSSSYEDEEDEVDFYIDEMVKPACSPPTKSHWDMVRPRTEDPEYQKQLRLTAAANAASVAQLHHNYNNNYHHHQQQQQHHQQQQQQQHHHHQQQQHQHNQFNHQQHQQQQHQIHHTSNNQVATVSAVNSQNIDVMREVYTVPSQANGAAVNKQFKVSPAVASTGSAQVATSSPSTQAAAAAATPRPLQAHNSSTNISLVTVSLGKMPHSPRRVRGETKKCRKVYGMEHKDLWCTQCKWKKACTRFND